MPIDLIDGSVRHEIPHVAAGDTLGAVPFNHDPETTIASAEYTGADSDGRTQQVMEKPSIQRHGDR